MIVHFRNNGNQDLKVKITLLRPGDEFHLLLLSSGSFQFGHHRIVTYGKQKYSCVPHSHVILHFCAFGLLSFLSPPACLLSESYSGSFIHSVLLWEICIDFSAHGWRRTLAISYSYGSILCFDRYFFLRRFWFLFCLFGFQFLAWDH